MKQYDEASKHFPTMKTLDAGKKEQQVAAAADGRSRYPRRHKAVLKCNKGL